MKITNVSVDSTIDTMSSNMVNSKFMRLMNVQLNYLRLKAIKLPKLITTIDYPICIFKKFIVETLCLNDVKRNDLCCFTLINF